MGQYSFHDTAADATAVTVPRPTEAVKFNGHWLDDDVTGFQTLYVSGREAYGQEVTSTLIGDAVGEDYVTRHYPPRRITVGYLLRAASAAAFRSAYNELNRYLNAEQAQLIFNDETDKYFIATPSSITEPEPGRNIVTGEIVFTCSDPRKWAVTPKTFNGADYAGGIQVITVLNTGNVPCPIDYEITMNSENGVIGISGDDGEMQYGHPEEVDGETVEESEVLFNLAGSDFFNNQTLTISDTDKGGITNFTKTAVATNGSMSGRSGSWLLPAANMTHNTGDWGGCVKTVTLPADSGGVAGAGAFELSASVVFEGTAAQTGCLRFAVSDAEGGLIASLHIVTHLRNSTAATIYCLVDGMVRQFSTNTTASGGAGRGIGAKARIRKTGSSFYFSFGKFSTTIEAPGKAEAVAKKATVWLAQYSGMSSLIQYMGVRDFSFRKDNVESYVDIPNRYQSGDVMTINGSEARMYLNGVPNVEDEIIGTKYFQAPPGAMNIAVINSPWASAVTAKAIIREAWV